MINPVKRLPTMLAPVCPPSGVFNLSNEDLSRICAEINATYQSGLRMQQETAELERREFIKTQASREREQQRAIIREELKDTEDLKNIEVFLADEKLMVAINRPNRGLGIPKPLFSEIYIGTYKFVCSFPEFSEIIMIVFRRRGEEIISIFNPQYDGKDLKHFSSSLEEKGICPRISDRKYEEVIRAFYVFVQTDAKVIVLPWHYGYTPLGDDQWAYAKPGCLTMKSLKAAERSRGNGFEKNDFKSNSYSLLGSQKLGD